MFNDKKKKSVSKNGDFSANTIMKGTTISGEIQSDNDIRIDGVLKGTINTAGKLVVGESGKIIGDIKCAAANIEGEIDGMMEVDNILILKNTALVKSDVYYGKLVVQEGAVLNGSLTLGTRKNGTISIENINDEQTKKQVSF